jgi:hypothetical protein
MIFYTRKLDLATLLDRTYQEKETQIEYQGHIFTIRAEDSKLQSEESEPLSVQLVRECREESANRWHRFFEKDNYDSDR